MIFHVLNRGVARMQLFEKPAGFQAFERVLQETREEAPMRVLAYCLMPNHWHLLLWPQHDGELAAFMQRLTVPTCVDGRSTAVSRGWAMGIRAGTSPLRFKVQSDEHFLLVARYVERNALRANFVLQAEEGRWSSLWRREHGTADGQSLLTARPVDRPATWVAWVNQAESEQELESLRNSVQHGRPFGTRNGRSGSPNAWAWNRRIAPRDVPRKLSAARGAGRGHSLLRGR
jgi:putative transposase